jgi:ribosomal protein S18 acetylase RimI-like enzyme
MVETIRTATAADVDTIKQIAIDTNMFGPDDVGFFDEMITGFLDGTMDDNHWLVVEHDEAVVAGAYYAPEPFSDRMWNLYFISVAPHHQGRGTGGKLLDHVEHELRASGSDSARVLIVETSSTDQYARTREFYRRHHYDEEARIREFYGPDDDKVVFWKSLVE